MLASSSNATLAFMKTHRLVALLLALPLFGFSKNPSLRYTFPQDASVLDVRRDFGAKGDGKTDDTEALQRAIEASCGNDKERRGGKTNALFLPNGTYRVTKPLVVKTALGPWLYGESRDGVVIKLDDGVKEVTSVLRTHPNEKGPTSADWFMRNLRHFTIDVGNNPETDGIRYYATNSGCLKDVRVIGRGKVGVNGGFLDQSGPNLIQDVEIDGFETGVFSQWIWSETLSRVTIKNCRKQGLYVSANVVAAEDLVVENTPLAVMNDMPKDWAHWSGVVALVGGRFSGGDGKSAAIINKGKLYARDVKTSGFARAIESSGSGGTVDGTDIGEFSSSKVRRLFDDAPDVSLSLPIQREPEVPWENDPAKWLCADDYGATASGGKDDSDAIQKAMDAAAAKGATVVYFRGCGGGEPNWFNLDRAIRVPAPVRIVMGLGWARLGAAAARQAGRLCRGRCIRAAREVSKHRLLRRRADSSYECLREKHAARRELRRACRRCGWRRYFHYRCPRHTRSAKARPEMLGAAIQPGRHDRRRARAQQRRDALVPRREARGQRRPLCHAQRRAHGSARPLQLRRHEGGAGPAPELRHRRRLLQRRRPPRDRF